VTPDPSIVAACALAAERAYSCATLQTPLAHALLLESDERCILAFRGTKEIEDWITDARFWRITTAPGQWVHTGFWDAWQSLKWAVLEMAEKSILAGKPFFVTGHSLGGALAVLCANELAGSGFKFAALHTFGQPRVGNSGFAAQCRQRFGDRHFRYVNAADIVPRMAGWLLGYRHSGNFIFLDPFGGTDLKPHLLWLAACDMFDLARDWETKKRLALLADHPIANYRNRLILL